MVGVCGFHVLRPRAYPSSENENDEQGINATNCFRFLAAGVWYSLGRFISFPLKEGKDNNCDDAVVATTTAPRAVVTATTTTTHGVVVQEATDAFGLRVSVNYFYFILSKPFKLQIRLNFFEVITMERKLLRVSDAAEKVYGCTKQNLYKLIRAGKLKTYTRYGMTVVNVDEVKGLASTIYPRGGDRKFKPRKLK